MCASELIFFSCKQACGVNVETCDCTQAEGEAELACVDCIAAVDPSFGAQAGLTGEFEECLEIHFIEANFRAFLLSPHFIIPICSIYADFS
jgi:hypothetical protein